MARKTAREWLYEHIGGKGKILAEIGGDAYVAATSDTLYIATALGILHSLHAYPIKTIGIGIYPADKGFALKVETLPASFFDSRERYVAESLADAFLRGFGPALAPPRRKQDSITFRKDQRDELHELVDLVVRLRTSYWPDFPEQASGT